MERVLITAGGSGIGKAIAESFARSGAQVWVTDIDKSLLEKCPDSWCKSAADASSETEMTNVIHTVRQKWGSIDTVIANAGIAGPTAKLEKIVFEDWRRCVSVNLDSAFLLSKLIIPIMKDRGSGNIILMASTAGLNGFPNRAPYASAKWGLIGLMKTLAMELGPNGIRVNAICPGCVEGPRINGVIEREAKEKGVASAVIRSAYESGTSLRTFVTNDDIANMALFLSSSSARHITGQAMAVDGHTENPDPKV